jgi:hypothetical protein
MLLAAAAMVMQVAAPKQSDFDKPMGELTGEKGDDPLDRMSLNQMMRMSTLPDARLREFQCAGVANAQAARTWPIFALSDGQRAEFVDRVAGALATDMEMEKDIAVDLIGKFSEEPPHRESKGELAAWRAEMEGNCSGLIARVRSGTYDLHPLAQPSVVNETLATCHVRYVLAAEEAEAKNDEEEAKGLRATAARAETLALNGKEGEALAKARDALAKRLAAARVDPVSAHGDDMMRLVMCLPAMDAAKLEQARR